MALAPSGGLVPCPSALVPARRQLTGTRAFQFVPLARSKAGELAPLACRFWEHRENPRPEAYTTTSSLCPIGRSDMTLAGRQETHRTRASQFVPLVGLVMTVVSLT